MCACGISNLVVRAPNTIFNSLSKEQYLPQQFEQDQIANVKYVPQFQCVVSPWFVPTEHRLAFHALTQLSATAITCQTPAAITSALQDHKTVLMRKQADISAPKNLGL